MAIARSYSSLRLNVSTVTSLYVPIVCFAVHDAKKATVKIVRLLWKKKTLIAFAILVINISISIINYLFTLYIFFSRNVII